MSFESLANELLLHLFEFFSTDHLIDAFHGLNSRFDSLLCHHFIVYGIDFRTLYFDDFSIICREYLPTLVDKLQSIHLSSKDGLLRSFNRLVAHGFTLDRFIGLKSLSLSFLSSEQITDKIMLGLPRLVNLTHLTLKHCDSPKGGSNGDYQSAAVRLINCIWSLPNLTHCHVDHIVVYIKSMAYFVYPTVISSSITHVSISCIADQHLNLNHLSKTTPHLQHFSIGFRHPCPDQFLASHILSITAFDVSFKACWCDLVAILQYMPNLGRLKVQCCRCIRGDEWERLISNHLPKLKIFHLKMWINNGMDTLTEDNVDKILDAYRTPFWLHEHGWFVRCDWNPTRTNYLLYTLPYAFDEFHIWCPTIGKSTCFQEMNEQSYDFVRSLLYNVESTVWSQPSDIQFCKLEKLEVTFPVSDYFWSIVPTFDRLTSCKIVSRDNSQECQRQIQFLISCASHLSSLEFCKNRRGYSIENSLLETRKSSLKRLDLQAHYASYDGKQCIRFAHSSLAMECEELHIHLKHRVSICDLVKKMHNLRLLYVTCDDVEKKPQWYRNTYEKDEDFTEHELIIWLHQHLSSLRTLVQIIGYRDNFILRFS